MPDLGLADAAGTQRIVEHHREQVDRAALTIHDDVDRFSGACTVFRAQRATPRLTHRPPADQADARHPVLLLPVADEMAIRQPEPAGDPLGLARFAVAPCFDQADHVRPNLRQGVLQGDLPSLPRRPVAPPDIPRDHPDGRLNERAVWRIRVGGHAASIAVLPHRPSRPALVRPTRASPGTGHRGTAPSEALPTWMPHPRHLIAMPGT